MTLGNVASVKYSVYVSLRGENTPNGAMSKSSKDLLLDLFLLPFVGLYLYGILVKDA